MGYRRIVSCTVRVLICLFVLIGAAPLCAQTGATGFTSPEMVMSAWARSVRQQDPELFTACYWSEARQLNVTADGGTFTVQGAAEIMESLRNILGEHTSDTSGFWLPVPLRYRDPDNDQLQYIYRDRAYPAINMVQFEEREDGWAISEQHLYWRNLTSYEPGPAQHFYDANEDGTLSLAEQGAMVEAYWLVTNGRHAVLTALDRYFDFDGNGYVTGAESRRARTVLFRDRLRFLPAIAPEFALAYLNPTPAGEVTIHAANAILTDFIDSETAVSPHRLSENEVSLAVADFDGDGWLEAVEIYAYAEMIVRVLAAIPIPYCFTTDTDGTTSEIIGWTDANGDGVVTDAELNDLGYLVFSALSGDSVIASAPLCRFDQDRDFLLSTAEQDALRAYFAIELLPLTVTTLGDIYPALMLLDIDDSGEMSRIEINSAMDLIANPVSAVGSRPNSPLDRRLDRKPSDGSLSGWEVWSAVGDVLAASSRQWIEARMGSGGEVVFESRDGSAFAADDGETQTLQADIEALQRVTATLGYSSSRSVGSRMATTTHLSAEIVMPEGGTSDGNVNLAAQLDPVFPVMYRWYAESWVGHAYLQNTADEAITNIITRVSIPRHGDFPIDSAPVESIGPGEVARLPVPALLDEAAVLGITEGRMAVATVEVDYSLGDERRTVSQAIPLEFYDRNAIRWDDDRKASSFVTARDDQVLLFTGNLNASMHSEFRSGLSHDLQLAMLLFDGLAEHGMVYRRDPSSPYTDYSQDTLAVDYLQFPRQTLTFRGGDCDDLSVCYAALLEAVGTPAAFVTTPGHIFIAVMLSGTEEEARRTYLFPDDLIYINSQVWLPVEVTALEGTFLEAWTAAARQWREASANGEAHLYPVRDAWQEYAPIGFAGFTLPLSAPDAPRVVERCVTELTQFVTREIADRETTILARLQEDPDDAELRNRLGTLYARYGLMDRATEQFQLVTDEVDFYPALLNSGNAAYLEGEFEQALDFYERALTEEPESGPALLGIARTCLEIEDYPRVRESYDQLKVVSPDLASQHSYLESRGTQSSRASSSLLTMPVVWVDE